jgi:hypothetical protein
MVFTALMILLVAGCKDAGTNPDIPPVTQPPTTGGTVSFAQKILPIFDAYGCTGCHGGNGGLYVGTVSQLLTGGLHGAAVIAGNADGSILVQKLSVSPPFGSRMPLGGPYLADSTIAVIKTWVNEGAKNN